MDYTKQFEKWWAKEFANLVNSDLQPILVETYKQVAFRAWQARESEIDRLNDKIGALNNEIASLVDTVHSMSWSLIDQ